MVGIKIERCFLDLQVVHYPVHVKVEKPVPYEVKGKLKNLWQKLLSVFWKLSLVLKLKPKVNHHNHLSSLQQSQNHTQS
jgi:hypothetical protein